MAGIPNRERYRRRIASLLATVSENTKDLSPESQAHWAKYLCVLTSGYLEQSVKEVLLDHASNKSSARISRYIEQSWPRSQNMSTENISKLLISFDTGWKDAFETWLAGDDNRKGYINTVISWRNRVAHGDEAATTGVTIKSVTDRFKCACDLVHLIQGMAA